MGQNDVARNWQFDFLKGMSCILVVFLHCRFEGTLGDIIIYACRFPVPVFFMITGYFCYGKNREWLRKRAAGMLRMLLTAEICYGAWYTAVAIFDGRGAEYLGGLSCLGHPIRTLLCGTMFNPTLWYLYAAFWTYVIYCLIADGHPRKWSYALIPILLAVQIYGRFYWQNHYDIDKAIYWFRSAFLFGLPMTLLGSLFAEKSEYIKRRFRPLHGLLIIAAGLALMPAEYIATGQYMDMHLSTVFITAGLFMTAMLHTLRPGRMASIISFIGRRLSMWVYLLHMWCSSFLELAARALPDSLGRYFDLSKPVLVCLLACLLGVAASRIKDMAAMGASAGR